MNREKMSEEDRRMLEQIAGPALLFFKPPSTLTDKELLAAYEYGQERIQSNNGQKAMLGSKFERRDIKRYDVESGRLKFFKAAILDRGLTLPPPLEELPITLFHGDPSKLAPEEFVKAYRYGQDSLAKILQVRDYLEKKEPPYKKIGKRLMGKIIPDSAHKREVSAAINETSTRLNLFDAEIQKRGLPLSSLIEEDKEKRALSQKDPTTLTDDELSRVYSYLQQDGFWQDEFWTSNERHQIEQEIDRRARRMDPELPSTK